MGLYEIVEPGEECDDGSSNSNTAPNACRLDCTNPRCGDGVTDSDEECDDSGVATAACDPDCTLPECGDGYANYPAGEDCDDANIEPSDGCDQCLPSEFLVNTETQGSQSLPAVAMAQDGRFVVVWQGSGVDSWDVFARRYDATGLPVGDAFLVNSTTSGIQWQPAVAMAQDGRFVIVWEDCPQDTAHCNVSVQPFDATGNPQGTEFTVSQVGANNQKHPSVGMASDGRFVVVWESMGQDGSNAGVYASVFAADGARAAPGAW